MSRDMVMGNLLAAGLFVYWPRWWTGLFLGLTLLCALDEWRFRHPRRPQ